MQIIEIMLQEQIMGVTTKSVYDAVQESDGLRLLVTRYWPRGLSKKRVSAAGHIKELAPSVEFLKDWKKGSISWQEYEERFLKEMSAQGQKIKAVAEMAKRQTVTLLCFEREDNPHCHRHILKRLVEQAFGR